jgi:hypothetical protein
MNMKRFFVLAILVGVISLILPLANANAANDPWILKNDTAFNSAFSNNDKVISLQYFNDKLWAFGNSNYQGTIMTFDGNAWTSQQPAFLSDSIIVASTVLNGKLYVSTTGFSAGSGRLYSNDGVNGWDEITDIPSVNYVYSVVGDDNMTCLTGASNSGYVIACNSGDGWEDVPLPSLLNVAIETGRHPLVVKDGNLYGSFNYENPQRVWTLMKYDGNSWTEIPDTETGYPYMWTHLSDSPEGLIATQTCLNYQCFS